MLRNFFWTAIILILLSLRAGNLFAQEATPSMIDFEIMREDDPYQAPEKARAQLKTLDRDKNPELYLRTLWQAFEINSPEADRLFPLVPEAMQLAEKLGLHEEWLRHKINAMRIELFVKKARRDSAYFETLIADARRVNVPRILSRLLFDYAFFLEEKGNLTASIRAQDEAYQIMLHNKMSDFDQAILKNLMAIHLMQQGQKDKALPMMLEVAQYCDKAQVRAFAAVALYNLARQYDKNQTEEDARKALTWYNKSIEAAKAINDQESLASSLYGLGSVFLTLKEWSKAKAFLEESLAMFKQQNDQGWSFEALILLSRLSRLLGKPEESLQYLLQTKNISVKEDEKLVNKLDEEFALVYTRLQNYAKATEYLQLTLQATRKLFAEQQQEEYQLRTVQMGLRVEEERNKVLLRENELQAQKLKQAEAFRLYFIVLSLTLIAMAVFIGLAIVQTLRIRKSKAKMREILDHIEEGILTFNSDLQIEAEYSAFLKEFTHSNETLQGQSIFPTLINRSTLHDEDKSMILETLKLSLGEESLSWELNESQLPRELVFTHQQERIAALHWVPMFNSHGILRRVLLTLRDVTEERHLSARIAQHEYRELNLQTKVSELLAAPIPAVVQFLQDISRIWPNEAEKNQGDISRTRMHLHTFKGIARSLGLKSFSHAIHDLEDHLEDETAWRHFFDNLGQYQQLVGRVFHNTDRASSTLQKNLPAVVAELMPTFVEQMQQGGCTVASCWVDDAVMHWPDRLLQDVRNTLVHALNNCADHGFIRPQQKMQKVAPARIGIRAFARDDRITVHILDNGVGLNRELLMQAARERGFVPEIGHTLYDVVFQDGLSTADQTNLTSGRGVGLTAVAAICKDWQGEAHIFPEESTGGTRMELWFRIAYSQ